MKHLKTYKIFENKSKIDEITSVIKDMLLDFEDDDFVVKVDSSGQDKWDDNITIHIESPLVYVDSGTIGPGTWTSSKKTPFNVDRVLRFTDRIREYFKMDNIKYDIQYQWYDTKGEFKETNLDETELPSGDITSIWIEIFIDKSTYKIFESTKSLVYPEHGQYKQTLKDICLDLTDEGYKVKVLVFQPEISVTVVNDRIKSKDGDVVAELVSQVFDRLDRYMSGEGFKSKITKNARYQTWMEFKIVFFK